MKNYEQYKRMIRFLTSVTILAAEIGIYWLVWETSISEMAGTPFFRKGDWLMIAVYGLLLLFFSKMYGGLKIGYLERGNVLYSQILAVSWSMVLHICRRPFSQNTFWILPLLCWCLCCRWSLSVFGPLVSVFCFRNYFHPDRCSWFTEIVPPYP